MAWFNLIIPNEESLINDDASVCGVDRGFVVSPGPSVMKLHRLFVFEMFLYLTLISLIWFVLRFKWKLTQKTREQR